MGMDRGETELEVERTEGMKHLYGTKQKRVDVAYAEQHSVATATKKFSILTKTKIGRWMVDGYFERDVTKQRVKRGAGRSLTYSREIDEQLLVWVLENCDLHLPITVPRLKDRALELN